jgi:allene oxide cyclase
MNKRALLLSGVLALLTPFVATAAQTLQVIEVAQTNTVIDLGPKGDSMGDLFVFANPVFDPTTKKQIGMDQGSCVRVIIGKSWECSWTVTLAGGVITAEGAFVGPADSTLAVTGGTGQYAGAKGNMTLHALDPKMSSFLFTYNLL